METLPANLRQKLAKIRCTVHNVEKRGRNDFHKYDYAQASDVAGLLGTQLAEANIVVARRNLEVTRHRQENAKGNPETVIELKCEYGFLDGDSDEQIWHSAYGEGIDSADKASYKAWTGMLKYFLIQAFLLATGDDPEDSAKDDAERHRATPTTPPMDSAPKTPQGTANGAGKTPAQQPTDIATALQRKSLMATVTRTLGADGTAWIVERLKHYGYGKDTLTVEGIKKITEELIEFSRGEGSQAPAEEAEIDF